MKLTCQKAPPPTPPPAPKKPDGFAFGSSISFAITNCTVAQAMFLGELSKLFCDPVNAEKLAALQQGTLVIGFGPKGALNLFSNPLPGQPGEVALH